MERCRLCSLSGTTISIMKIFDEEGILLKLKERILNRLQIVIYEYDLLPKIICRVCYGELEKYESFIEKAQKTQEVLLRRIQRRITLFERSVTSDEIKQEPNTLEDDYGNNFGTGVQELSTGDDLDMMEFVEVNPFIKMEQSECLDDDNLSDAGLILDSNDDDESLPIDQRRILNSQLPNTAKCHIIREIAPLRSQKESIRVDKKTISKDSFLDNGNKVETISDHHERNYNSEIDADDISFDDDDNSRCRSQPQSWERYEQEYTKFTRWKTEHNYEDSSSENVLLNYFKELSTTKAPTTQWAVYSMLKSTLQKKEKINIEKYSELLSLLRNNSKNYSPKSKQTVMFTCKNVEDYYLRANDDEYLFQKVVMIFSIHGATCQELVQLVTDEVKLYRNEDTMQTMFLVTIPKEKTKTKESPHRLMISRPDYFETVKKYRDLRSKKISTDRFFIRYDRKRKHCINQAVGIHTFTSIPKQIARFLQLPDPETYNGHSFKRLISTTNSANVDKRISDIENRRNTPHLAPAKQCTEDGVFLKVRKENSSHLAQNKLNKSDKISLRRHRNPDILNVGVASDIDKEYVPPCKRFDDEAPTSLITCTVDESDFENTDCRVMTGL